MAKAKLYAASGEFKNEIDLPAVFDTEVNKVCIYLQHPPSGNCPDQDPFSSQRRYDKALEAKGNRSRSRWSEYFCRVGSW